MHRMHRFPALFGLVATLGLFAGTATPASGSLLRPGAARAYPDVAADINGNVTYTYDDASQTGVFHVTNTPYLLAAGTTSANEYLVQLDPGTNSRSQEIKLLLDSTGQLIPSTQNLYELYGTIVAEGETYSGLLLKGIPTSFGSQDLGPVGVSGADMFDVEMDITGGALASFFGDFAYMRISPELASSFQGKFDEDFAASKATSNTRSYRSPLPFPIPEPSTVALLVLGLGGTALGHAHRHTRRTF